jgi:S-adenosylmethionine:tRNA ribosyltransferase-isomerase
MADPDRTYHCRCRCIAVGGRPIEYPAWEAARRFSISKQKYLLRISPRDFAHPEYFVDPLAEYHSTLAEIVSMRTSDFDYFLPKDCIAQRPFEPRDHSRLLVYDRTTDQIEHRVFHEILDYLDPKDVLVLNETKVLPARLKAYKVPTGGAAEVLILKRINTQTWEAIVGGKGMKPGQKLQILNGPEAEILQDLGHTRRIIYFHEKISHALDQIGQMPVPPYIHIPLQKPSEYQTVFANVPGSAAAPTAGLHFTDRLLDKIRAKGVQIAMLTLHVGLDTFAPVTEADPQQHFIHQEWCQLTEQAASIINNGHQSGGRIIAVGTTCVRTLETAALNAKSNQRVAAFEGNTNLFILPGFNFRVVDTLITNFHLPRSTLLMMISAFVNRRRILEIYQHAMQKGYRFYSFGDAMLIL